MPMTLIVDSAQIVHVGAQAIPLHRAWICGSCPDETITDQARACPSCASTNLMPLARWLGRVLDGR